MAKEIQSLVELNNTIGNWDVPGDSNEVQGILQMNDNRIQMLTAESFEKCGIWFDGNQSYQLIDGFTATGKEITLYGNMIPAMTLNMPGMQQLVYSPTYIFIGKQYEVVDFKLKKISALFDGLAKWIEQQSFYFTRNDSLSEATIRYRKPIYEKVRCKNKTIYFETDCQFNVDNFSSGEGKQRTWLVIEFDEAIEWSEAYSELFDYSEFLTLCFGTKCSPKNIKASDEEGTSIQIFENTVVDNDFKLKSSFLIPYTDIKGDYASVLSNWYAKQEEISPVISYFVDAHSKERVVKVIPGFLRMVQALESFSRRLRQGTLVPEAEHKARVERIVSRIDDVEDNKWLADVLSTPVINEPSCQQRIKRLFDEIPDSLFLSRKKLKSLSFKIVSTRNYYTHFNESLKDKILDTQGMFYSITFMKYVLRILLVKELGINMDKVAEHMKTDSEFITAIGALELRK